MPSKGRELAAEKRRRDAAWPPFERLCMPWLTMTAFTSTCRRLAEALTALRDWRRVAAWAGGTHEEAYLALRLVADGLAGEINAAAGLRQDPATVAWVVAGLRCPLRPFCAGCEKCQTVACPDRPAGSDL